MELECTKLNGIEDDEPLLKDLHDLSVKHGQDLIVVAVDPKTNIGQAHIADQNPEKTPVKIMARQFERAGLFLIKASGSLERFKDRP
jgi:hypothetical protein